LRRPCRPRHALGAVAARLHPRRPDRPVRLRVRGRHPRRRRSVREGRSLEAGLTRFVAAMFVTRFAPSPTGRLHKGHAFSALTAWREAKGAGERCLLRIEDIDPQRCRPEFEVGIYEDLAWLGLDWETPVRRQSDHLTDYAAVVEALDRHGLLYRCFRTRKEILDAISDAPHGPAEAARPGPHPADEEAR